MDTMDRFQKYIVESRHPDGSLNVKDTTCPLLVATYNQICDVYFREHPEADSTPQEAIKEYFNSKGWYFRPKTW
jgi:hypothetical protein